jgi:hypothetical protein
MNLLLAGGAHRRPLRIFVRQPFTQTGNRERGVIQGVLEVLRRLDAQPHRLQLLTGGRAESSQTFRDRFERDSGLPFTPRNFRAARLRLLSQADAMVVIRTGLSESGAFELAYNIFGGRRAPVFFAVWEGASFETTLLRELGDLVAARYVTFAEPMELRLPLMEFLDACVGSPAARRLTGARRVGPGFAGAVDARSADPRLPIGEYDYGFVLNRSPLDSRVDEGGESG